MSFKLIEYLPQIKMNRIVRNRGDRYKDLEEEDFGWRKR